MKEYVYGALVQWRWQGIPEKTWRKACLFTVFSTTNTRTGL